MPALAVNVCALGVATLYYTWRDVYMAGIRKQRTLCERVAYMLWMSASQMH